jgi:nucleoside-diphosphate-sugar epimerase
MADKAAIVVTGANGFIGSAVVSALLAKGKDVRSVVRSMTEGSAVAVGDVGVATEWSSVLANAKQLVHTAARVHVMCEKAVDPLLEFRLVNVAGTLNLAWQAARAGIQRFIFISSVGVHGVETLPGQRLVETDEFAPVSPYSISKKEAEEGLWLVAGKTGMEIVVIRPPLVYGPGVKAHFLTMMRLLNNRIPLPLGAIHNLRSFVALDNLVNFIDTCLEHHAAANQTFFISDGHDLSTTDLLRLTAQALDRSCYLLPVPQSILWKLLLVMGRGEIARRICSSFQVNIDKSHRLLDWSPPYSVDATLADTAAWFINNR